MGHDENMVRFWLPCSNLELNRSKLSVLGGRTSVNLKTILVIKLFNVCFSAAKNEISNAETEAKQANMK